MRQKLLAKVRPNLLKVSKSIEGKPTSIEEQFFNQSAVDQQLAQLWSEACLTSNGKMVMLYHGTTCMRRLEIKRWERVMPGRSGYVFLCAKPEDAFLYARTAALRDVKDNVSNSIVCEPVVLTVGFDVELFKQLELAFSTTSNSLYFATSTPVPVSAITQVAHCMHELKSGNFKDFLKHGKKSGQCIECNVDKIRSYAGSDEALNLGASLVSAAMASDPHLNVSSGDELKRLGYVQSWVRKQRDA